MRPIVKFLGSLPFALILIFLSAVSVIAGTLIEGASSSHELAENWIYRHPLFQLLLAGYFLNILLSALSRYPFKKGHIPFLMTHLGLLMVISGVFVKMHFGVQGHLFLIEGSASDDLTHPGTKSLIVEQLSPRKTLSLPLSSVNVLESYPHVEQRFSSWIFDGIPHLHPTEWGDLIINIEKEGDDTHLIAEDPVGNKVKTTFSSKFLRDWIVYDRGFQGYALQAKIPLMTPEDQKRIDQLLELDLKNNSALSPPLELIRNSSTLLDFPKSFIRYLRLWKQADSWLFDVPYPAKLRWNEAPETMVNALYWMNELLEEPHFLQNLKEKKWPLYNEIEKLPSKEEQYQALMAQIYAIQDQLPAAPAFLLPQVEARMLSAYLRLFSIHYDWIPKPDIPLKTVTLESPLKHTFKPAPLPENAEKATPGIVISFFGEKIPLIYDAQKTKLKQPAQNGNYLLSFQPMREKIPYLVRLHQALDIKYPGSEKTASYECTLSLLDKRTGETTRCALQMNRVFETADGYRFYLSGMGVIDPYQVRSVQLVVNQDPAKRWLTYPGGALVALGIFFLFFVKNRPKS